jgi:hypothetical protein
MGQAVKKTPCIWATLRGIYIYSYVLYEVEMFCTGSYLDKTYCTAVYISLFSTRIKTAIQTEAQVEYTNVYFYYLLVTFITSNTAQLVNYGG